MNYRRQKKAVAAGILAKDWPRRAWLELQALPARRPFRAWAGERSWSENGEDDVLLELAGDCLSDGFYVDVGANLPTKRSNTFRLYCRGMRGVCVEPNLELASLYERVRPRDMVVCAAVGSAPGVAMLQRFNFHVFSTCSQSEGERLEAERERMRTRLLRISPVPMLPLTSIMEAVRSRFAGPFFLLKTDTEGLDLEVLRSNDWQRDRPRYVLTESSGELGEVHAFLEKNDYRLHTQFHSNQLFEDAREVAAE